MDTRHLIPKRRGVGDAHHYGRRPRTLGEKSSCLEIARLDHIERFDAVAPAQCSRQGLCRQDGVHVRQVGLPQQPALHTIDMSEKPRGPATMHGNPLVGDGFVGAGGDKDFGVVAFLAQHARKAKEVVGEPAIEFRLGHVFGSQEGDMQQAGSDVRVNKTGRSKHFTTEGA